MMHADVLADKPHPQFLREVLSVFTITFLNYVIQMGQLRD